MSQTEFEGNGIKGLLSRKRRHRDIENRRGKHRAYLNNLVTFHANMNRQDYNPEHLLDYRTTSQSDSARIEATHPNLTTKADEVGLNSKLGCLCQQCWEVPVSCTTFVPMSKSEDQLNHGESERKA